MGADTADIADSAAETSAAGGVRVLLHVWIFCLVLALYPYVTNPASPIKHLLSGWIVVAATLLYAVAATRGRMPLRLGGGVLWVAAAFLGIHIISALASEAPTRGLMSLRPWTSGLVLALLAAQAARQTRHALGLLLSVCIAVALSSVYGYLQRFGLDPFPWAARGIEEYIGMPSTYANPNFAGHTLLLALIISGGLLLHQRRWWWMLVPCAALIASHLVLTNMRGARVGLAVALMFTGVVLVLVRRGARPVRTVAGLIAVALVLGGALTGAALLAGSRGDDAVPLDGASVLRLNGYYGAAQMALARPLLGFGPGSYDVESPRFWTPYEQQWFASEGKKNDHVHNDLLETAADGGLLAAALYLGLLLFAILASFRLAVLGLDADQRKLGWILGACFVAFAVDGLFGFNLRVPVSAGLFFLLLGILHAQTAPGHSVGKLATLAIAVAMLAVSLACALGSTAVFRGESLLQQARGAQVYGKEQRDAGNMDGATLGYDAGIRLGLAAARWQPYDGRNGEIAGQCAMILGRFAEADLYFEMALEATPNTPSLHAMQAQARSSAMFSRDDLDVFGADPDPAVIEQAVAAEEAAARALDLCPTYAIPREVLGRVLQARAEHEPAQRDDFLHDARFHLEQALRNGARGRADLNSRIADICVALNDTDGAETAFRRALEESPQDEALWNRYAEFSHRAGRMETFAETLKQRAAFAPDTVRDALLLRRAFFLAFEQRDTKQGRAIALEICRRAPGDPAAWGLALFTSGNATLAGLDAALSLGDRSAVPAWISALAEVPTGDAFVDATRGVFAAMPDGLAPSAASRGYRWAAAILEDTIVGAALTESQEGATRLALAEIYARCGRAEEALRNSDRAAALLSGPEQARALVLAAEALAKMKRGPEALRKAREAARVAPGNSAVRHVLAQRLLAEGLLAEARFEYTALVKSPPPGAGKAITREAATLEARLAAQGAGGGA